MDLKNIKQCSLSEALKLYTEALSTKDEIAIKTIEGYILQNHSITNSTKLRCALTEIEDLDSNLFTKEMKQGLIEVKLCAFEIAEHLDPVHINSYAMIETIIAEVLSKSKMNTENRQGIAKLLSLYKEVKVAKAKN